MGKIARFKLHTLVQILIFLNYSRTIMAHGLVSKVKRNSPNNEEGVSARGNQPEENWIVVNEISCWESNGRWEKEEFCPFTKIVTGHRFRFLSRTGLTGLELKCTEKSGKDESESEHILETVSKNKAEINLPQGEWENWTQKSRSSFAEGFSFAPGEMNLRRSVKNFNMIYHTENQNQTEVTKQSALNSGKVVTKCPQNHAICGVKWMMDKDGLGILTGIRLKCCFHCVPEEIWEIVHHNNNTNSFHYQVHANATVGLQKSQQNVPSDPFKTIAPIFGLIGKSDSTGFDWAQTRNSIWTNATAIRKSYSCPPNRFCTFKQLVGQCGSVRIPVDKFYHRSIRTGCDTSKFCTDLEPIQSCSNAMAILPSPRSKDQTIYLLGNTKKVEVLCDFQVDGGGWTVIQKRTSGPPDEFNQNWNEYENGFGSLSGNFWLGLENIRALTKNGDQELRIELEDFKGEKKYAKYSSFSISDASDFYRLSIGGFSGNANDSMLNPASSLVHNGMRFTAKEKDNDLRSWGNCAVEFSGGWWFNDCFGANLNGLYQIKGETVSYLNGIYWSSWKGWDYSLAKTEMKIRKKK